MAYFKQRNDDSDDNSSKLRNQKISHITEKFIIPQKDFARMRNAKAVMSISLILNAFFNIIIAIFSYVEIAEIRFHQVLVFAVIYTVILVIYLVIYYTARLYSKIIFDQINKKKRTKKLKLYDDSLIYNIQDQYTLDYFLPWPSIMIIIMRWTFYGKLGTIDDFNTLEGIYYGAISIISFTMALISILLVISCTISYYVQNLSYSKPKNTFEKIRPNEFFDFNDDDNEENFNIQYKKK